MGVPGGWRSKRAGRIVVGLLGVLFSVGYTIEATYMPFGSATAPGPGMFPLGVGVIACVISVVVVIEAMLMPVVEGNIDVPRGQTARLVGGFTAATVLFVVLLPVLGQYVAAVLYTIAMIKLIGPHSWVRSAVYGAVAGVVISWIFIQLLDVRMPVGSLWTSFF